MSFTPAHEPRWRDVYLASAARGVSALGDFLAATVLALALQGRGAGGMAVAGLLLASTVPLVLLAPVAGRIADRIDSRALLLATGLAQAAVCTLLAYTAHPIAIIGLVAVLAAGYAVTSPTLTALIPDMVGSDHLPRASAVSQTAGSLGMLAGPALAGVLVGQFGVRVPLLIDAATYLAIVVAALLIRTRRGGRVVPAGNDTSVAAPAPAWSVRSDSLLFTLIVAVAVIVGATTAVNVADVFFVRETLHASETAYGLVGAVWTAGMLAGAWLAARVIRPLVDGTLALVTMGTLGGLAAVLLVSAGVPSVLWLLPLWVVGGVANGGLNVTSNVIIARRVPGAARGRAIGAFVGVVNAANVIGFLLGGAVLEVITPRPLIAGAGLAGVLAVLACLGPIVRAVRREAAAGAPAAATPPDPAPAPVAG